MRNSALIHPLHLELETARFKQENHLRHTAQNEDQLELIVLRLRDELGELRRQWEEWKKHIDARLDRLAEVAQITTEKIRAHLLQTTEETHRRELAEVEQSSDWKRRQQLREAADNAHTVRLSRIEELAVSFAEIEGRGTATSVSQEMTRILTEQGVDEAIAYVGSQQASIFKTVRARVAAIHERNRADLQPLLQIAALYQAKGQATETRTLYAEILAVEPDWPEALHATFWFLTDQGDLARLRTTLAAARHDYEDAHKIAQRLIAADVSNTEWQRDLSVSHNKIGDVLVAQGDGPGALASYRKGLVIREGLATRDRGNAQWQIDVAVSCAKLGTHPGIGSNERWSYLQRGLKIQQDLNVRNRLAPTQNWIGWFEQRLKELDGAESPTTPDQDKKRSRGRKKS